MNPSLRPTILTTSIPAATRRLAWLAPIVCACNASALTWNTNGTNDNWTTSGTDLNWDAGVAWTNNNQAVFGGTNGEAITVSTVTASKITFNNTGTAYSLSGGTITLATVGDPVIDATVDATINSNITLSGAQTWYVSSGKTLTLGNINASAANTNFGFGRSDTAAGTTGSYLVNGSIGGNVGSVLFNSAANRNVTVTFTQANTFSGQLWLGNGGNASTLNFSDVSQLGVPITAAQATVNNHIALQNGSTLNYTGTGSQSMATRWLYWNAGTATISVANASANLTLGATGGTRNQNFTKTGAGTLTLDSTATISGGTLTVNQGTLALNAASSSTGATTISGSGTTLTLGTGGALNNTSAISIGTGATLNLSGAAFNQLASGASSTLAINGTLNATTNQAHTLAYGATYFSTIAMNNGTLANTFGQNTSGFGAFYFGASKTITATGTNTISGLGVIGIVSGAVLTLSPTNSDDSINVTGTLGQGASGTAGGIAKAGLGTVTLSGTGNLYTGTTTVNAGSLVVNGTKTGAGAVTVNAAGTLGGNGSIAGATSIEASGTVSPGDVAGATTNLTFTSTVNVKAGSTYAAEIASGGNDKITSSGTLTINGTVKVTLLGGYSPTAGTSFDLADATIAGTPNFDFTAANLGAGLGWNTASFATNGTISVVATDPFSAWASTHSLTGGKEGDDDHDGVSNLLEFATAADPQSGASGARAYPLVHNLGGQNVLTYTIAVRAGATFAASGAKQQADKDAVRYIVEASDDLVGWNTVVVTELDAPDSSAVQGALAAQLGTLDPAWQWHSFRTDDDVASDASDFIRLNVAPTP